MFEVPEQVRKSDQLSPLARSVDISWSEREREFSGVDGKVLYLNCGGDYTGVHIRQNSLNFALHKGAYNYR